MRPEERDKAYLWDMLDGARTARDLCAGLNVMRSCDYDGYRASQA